MSTFAHTFLSDNEDAIQNFRERAREFRHARGELDEASEALRDELTHNLIRIRDAVNTALDELTDQEKEDGLLHFLPTALQWVLEWKRGDTDPEFQITEFSEEQVVILVNPPRGHSEWPRHFLDTSEVKIPTPALALTDDVILEAVLTQIEETRTRLQKDRALEKTLRAHIMLLNSTIAEASNQLQEAQDQLRELPHLQEGK